VWINYEEKSVGISLLPHLINYQPYQFPDCVQIGQRFEDAKIIMVLKQNGLLLQLQTEPEQLAYVPVRSLVCLSCIIY